MPVTDIKWLKTLANFPNSGSFLFFLITQTNALSLSVALLITHGKSVSGVLDCCQNPDDFLSCPLLTQVQYPPGLLQQPQFGPLAFFCHLTSLVRC